MLGRSRLSSSHFLPRTAKELSLESKSPRLVRSARSIASLNDNGKTVPVALPSGTLLKNGFWVELKEAGEADSLAGDAAELVCGTEADRPDEGGGASNPP